VNDPRRVLLVGGGINHLIAQRVAERGERALIVTRLPPPSCGVDHLAADLGIPQAWSAAVDAGRERLGGLDVVVNCISAVPSRRALGDRCDEDWFTAIREQVLTTLRGCLRAIDLMTRTGGVIVNLTAARPWPDDVRSATSLAALAALETTTHALALEAGRGIRVLGIAPQVNGHVHAKAAVSLNPLARFPLIAFAESVAVVDSILGVIDDPTSHDATYRLDSGELLPGSVYPRTIIGR
jgi:NAD(P)-dependent dehydrogenase (short-subunit alcohol dehydrogenase family)